MYNKNIGNSSATLAKTSYIDISSSSYFGGVQSFRILTWDAISDIYFEWCFAIGFMHVHLSKGIFKQ